MAYEHVEGLTAAPLRIAGSPAWLLPWIRVDFEYGLVQHAVDISAPPQTTDDCADALVALAEGLAPERARWHLVTGSVNAIEPWKGAEVEAIQPAGATERVSAARRGTALVALVAAPTSAPPVRDILADAALVLLVLDGWDVAVIAGADVLAAARRIGVHVRSEALDPPPRAVGPARDRRPHARWGVPMAIALLGMVAVGVVVTRWQAPERVSAPAAGSAPKGSAGAGLFLPSSSRFPGGRTGAAVSFDPLTGSVTLFGGGRLGPSSSSDLFPRDTWTWDVSGWHRVATVSAPPAVTDPAFAYDENTGSALLFGGIGGDGSTWQWNGLAWRRLDPTQFPQPQVFASAVYDPRRQSVVLATLCCQTSQAGSRVALQTWEWRDDTWVPLRARDAPVLSRAPLLTYDAVRGEMLLFTQGSTAVNDATDQVTATSTLWSFDGTRWRHLATPVSPPYDPIRDRFGYDPASRRVVLFQGGDLATWTWDGSLWRRLPAGGPLYSGAMTTDAMIGKILLFGGAVPADDLSSVWTLDAGRWKRVTGR